MPNGTVLAGIVGGFGFVGAGLLALLGRPVVVGDPLFGFGLRIEPTEVVRRLSWPRDFYAPMAGLSNRSQHYRTH